MNDVPTLRGRRRMEAIVLVWRTAPLWDVAGSLKIGGLLHDGRARDVAEAVEWHDGEARAARARFRALSAPDKAALVAFVSGR